MGDEYQIVYDEVDLDVVVRHWAKGYKPPKGGKVSLVKFWVDPAKNTVICKLYQYPEDSDG